MSAADVQPRRGRPKKARSEPSFIDLTADEETTTETTTTKGGDDGVGGADANHATASPSEKASRPSKGKPRGRQRKVAVSAPPTAAAAAQPIVTEASAVAEAQPPHRTTSSIKHTITSSPIAAAASADAASSAAPVHASRVCAHCAFVFQRTDDSSLREHEEACVTRTSAERTHFAQVMKSRSDQRDRARSQQDSANAPSDSAAAVSHAPAAAPAASVAVRPVNQPRACRYCQFICRARLTVHENLCANRTFAERAAHLAAQEKRRTARDSAAAADSTAAAPAMPRPPPSRSPALAPKKPRRSKISPSDRVGLVKGVSSFPLVQSAMMQKVGYTLGSGDKDAASKLVYEVEAIRSRRFNEETLQYEYLVKWLGWSEEDNSVRHRGDDTCTQQNDTKRTHF